METALPATRRIVLASLARGAGAVALSIAIFQLAPPTSIGDEIFERAYRNGSEPAELLEPLLQSGVLILPAFLVLLVFSFLLVCLNRIPIAARCASVITAVAEALSALILLHFLLSLIGMGDSPIPEEAGSWTAYPEIVILIAVGTLALPKLGHASGKVLSQGNSVRSFAQGFIFTLAYGLRQFPVYLLSVSVFVEFLLKYPGAANLFFKAVQSYDSETALSLAIIASIFVVVCRFLSELLMLALPPQAAKNHPVSPWWPRLRRSPIFWLGAALLLSWCVVAAIPDTLVPHDPSKNDFSNMLLGPSEEHLLGTDAFGRDVLGRTIHGAPRVVAMVLAIVAIGAMAGYALTKFDRDSLKLTAFIMSIPNAMPMLMLLLFLKLVLYTPTIILAGYIAFLVVARLSEDIYDSVKTTDGDAIEQRPIPVGLLASSILRYAAYAVAVIVGIDFISLGTQEPSVSWGLSIDQSDMDLVDTPWVMIAPSLAVVSLMLGLSLLARCFDITKRSSTP